MLYFIQLFIHKCNGNVNLTDINRYRDPSELDSHDYFIYFKERGCVKIQFVTKQSIDFTTRIVDCPRLTNHIITPNESRSTILSNHQRRSKIYYETYTTISNTHV